MALLIFNGVSLHVIMMVSTFMLTNGVIGSTALVLVQFVNVGLVLLIPWLGGKVARWVFWPDLFLPKRRTETTDSNGVLTVVHTKGILLDAPNKSLKRAAPRAAA